MRSGLKVATWACALLVALLAVFVLVRRDLEPGMGLRTTVSPWISVPSGFAGSVGFMLLTLWRRKSIAAALAILGTAILALSLHVLYWNPTAGEIKEYWGPFVISKDTINGFDDRPPCSETTMSRIVLKQQGAADLSYFRGIWPASFPQHRLPVDLCGLRKNAS